MNLDFLLRLKEHLDTLNLFAPVNIGNLEYDDSISIIAQPGGIKTLFYDGQRDQTYNIQLTSKSKAQFDAIDSLSSIMSDLVQLTILPSQNESYTFSGFNIESPPTYVGQDEQGNFVYALQCTSRMIIRKGVI